MAKAYKHGSMDTKEHEIAFSGFIKWIIRVSVISIFILIFLAIFNS